MVWWTLLARLAPQRQQLEIVLLELPYLETRLEMTSLPPDTE